MELFHCAGPVRFSRQTAVSRVYDIGAKFTLMMTVKARSNLDVDQLNPLRLFGLTSPKLDRDGVTVWLGRRVLESVPEGVEQFTLSAAFVDEAGRIGMDRITLKVDRSKSSGQALTPEPFAVRGTEGLAGAPEVTMIAPPVPTSIAVGAQDNTLNATNGALFFIQVDAVAQANAEIAVSENGIRQGVVNPTVSLIPDGSQIPNPTTGCNGRA
jgi:hypothetical protein